MFVNNVAFVRIEQYSAVLITYIIVAYDIVTSYPRFYITFAISNPFTRDSSAVECAM